MNTTEKSTNENSKYEVLCKSKYPYTPKKARVICNNEDGSKTVVSFNNYGGGGDETSGYEKFAIKIYTLTPTKQINSKNEKIAKMLQKMFTKRKLEYSTRRHDSDVNCLYQFLKRLNAYYKKDLESNRANQIIGLAAGMVVQKIEKDQELEIAKREAQKQKICADVKGFDGR